jgi:hypothetical protein
MSHVDILKEQKMGVEKFYEKLTGINREYTETEDDTTTVKE